MSVLGVTSMYVDLIVNKSFVWHMGHYVMVPLNLAQSVTLHLLFSSNNAFI